MVRITSAALLAVVLSLPIVASAQTHADSPAVAASDPHKFDGTRKMVELLKENARHFNVLNNPLASTVRAKGMGALVQGAPENEALWYEEMLKAGMTSEAIAGAQKLLTKPGLSADKKLKYQRLLALGYLRLGEQENCVVNHTAMSCLVPIEGEGIHKIQRGSRSAIEVYSDILKQYPGNVPCRWLLNLAYMTLGEYPDKVPSQWLYPPEIFKSDYNLPRFTDIAPAMGMDISGLSGGCCTEDFDRDGDIDILISSWGVDEQMHYWRNNGDGTFTDRSTEAGLIGITGGINMFHADYNNDGYADVFITRGAWMGPYGNQPQSLLRNNGDGTFTDVTIESGILGFHPTEAAAWGDFDNDGWLDLFIGNETTDQVHPCQLFHNNGNGTFTDVAHETGMDFTGMVKALSWGDFDNDGLVDLYVSSLGQINRLMKNNGKVNGKWSFTDVAAKAGVTGPIYSFPTFFFDYDNDGWLDLYVCDFGGMPSGSFNGLPVLMDVISPVVNDYLGKPHMVAVPALYHNNHNGTFTDVAKEMHLDKTMFGMGCNFGDIDNDGWLDIYVGTGHPDLEALIPNRMFRNAGGKVFQDVTTAGGFGHLQKGHAIAFADLDNDGDQDIYALMGGAFSGDVARKCIFQNPGNSNHWVTLILEGVKANRSAIGARIKVSVKRTNGAKRDIYIMAGTGGSFGSSSLQQEIGLGDAQGIEAIAIDWPGSHTKQTFKNVAMDRTYSIREGGSDVAVVDRHPIVMPAPGAAMQHHDMHDMPGMQH